jgi:hypothetical protein
MTTALDRIIDALAKRNGIPPRKVGAEWIALCPAHDDTKPSLGVRGIQGQVLICCRSQGCPSKQIMAGLNMTLADLFDDRKGTSYTYDDGRVVHRMADKRFFQFGNTKDRPQLYRLDQIRRAVKDDIAIWLVEGEKDVHALESLGAVATTAPMGAKNVSKCDLSPLHDAKLAIIADQDEAGQQWLHDVLVMLAGRAASITIGKPLSGKDSADHVAAGYGLADFQRVETPQVEPEKPPRRIVLTPASSITPRRVKWVWDGRIALGTLALLAGPEGLGKSTLAYWVAARITRGELPGEDLGTPRAILVCATEDSWEYTIVPRLMAAGADLSLVHRVEVKDADDITLGLSLPKDLHDLKEVAVETEAALLILDPLMSRLSEELDTHKDGEVRRALEPLVGIADVTRMAIIGLIHHNKSGSSDPLSLVMASKAFTAVARSVHTVIKDPDDETEQRRLFGTPKNNLGRTDLAVMSFTIARWEYDTEDGPGDTGQLIWGEDVDGTIGDAIRRAGEDPDKRTAAAEAADWLDDYMAVHGPKVSSKDAKKAASAAGHGDNALRAARQKLRIQVIGEGFPRVTYWVRHFVTPGSVRDKVVESSRVDSPGETHHLTQLNSTGQTRTTEGTSMPHSESNDVNVSDEQSRSVASSCEVPREEQTPLQCPDCGFGLDTQGHQIKCEEA